MSGTTFPNFFLSCYFGAKLPGALVGLVGALSAVLLLIYNILSMLQSPEENPVLTPGTFKLRFEE